MHKEIVISHFLHPSLNQVEVGRDGRDVSIKYCTVVYQRYVAHLLKGMSSIGGYVRYSPRVVNGDSIQLLRGEQLRRAVGWGEGGHAQPSLARLGRHFFTSYSTYTTAYAGTNSRKHQQFNMSLQNSSKKPFSKAFCL